MWGKRTFIQTKYFAPPCELYLLQKWGEMFQIFFCFLWGCSKWLIKKKLLFLQVLDIGITQFKTCTLKGDISNSLNKRLFTMSTISIFILPMTIISVLYVLIGLELRRSQMLKRNSVYVSTDRLKVNMKLLSREEKFVCIMENFFPENLWNFFLMLFVQVSF